MARVVSRPMEPEGLGSALSQPWDGLLIATLTAAWLGTGFVIVATIAFLSVWDATFCTDAAWCDDFSAAGPTIFVLVSAATLTTALVLARWRGKQRPVLIGTWIGAVLAIVSLVVAPWIDGPYIAGESIAAFGVATIPAGAWLGLYLPEPAVPAR